MEFHECLNKIMGEKGINQARLCKLSGIASSAMSHYVRGETEPSFTKAIKIARALDVSVDELAGENPELTPDEQLMLERYRKCSENYRITLLSTAELFSNMSDVSEE